MYSGGYYGKMEIEGGGKAPDRKDIMNAKQIARIENLNDRIHNAKSPSAEDKARDAMNAYMERLMDSGVAPEAIMDVVHPA